MATICAPLYRLLRKESVFRWGAPQQAAFNKGKEVLSSASVLVYMTLKRNYVFRAMHHHIQSGSSASSPYTWLRTTYRVCIPPSCSSRRELFSVRQRGSGSHVLYSVKNVTSTCMVEISRYSPATTIGQFAK